MLRLCATTISPSNCSPDARPPVKQGIVERDFPPSIEFRERSAIDSRGHAHGNLVVHGDGTRERQMWGPESADGPPRMTTVLARRYQCQRCGTCMLMVPGEVLRRRLYTAPAIGLALALWALLGVTVSGVRARVSPLRVLGAAAAGRWATLRRWARDTIDGRLFSTWRVAPDNFTLRNHAERAAAMLRALGPSALPVADAVFAGAARHRSA